MIENCILHILLQVEPEKIVGKVRLRVAEALLQQFHYQFLGLRLYAHGVLAFRFL